MSGLSRAVGSLARVLEERRVPYMIIGGLANLVWGVPRATLDVDASVLVEDTAWRELIVALRRTFRIIPKDPMGFLRDTHVLPLEAAGGVRIDLLWAVLPYEHRAIARATVEDVAGQQVRVCRPEDLILHKIVSDRPKDREDIRGIVRRQRARLDRRYLSRTARELAQALEQPELVAFLNTCFRQAGI